MATILGSGQYRYEVDENWGKLPDGWTLMDVAGVAIDSKDQVYVFNSRRASDDRVRSRRQLSALLGRRHVHSARTACTSGPDDTLYCTDDGDHTVRKCTLEGKVLLHDRHPGQTLAVHERRAVSSLHAHRAVAAAAISTSPTATATRACTNIRRTASCCCRGASRAAIRASSISPHNICCDADGWVYVADRENHRVQVFDGNGKYETQWNNLHRPCGLYMEPRRHPICYIGELGPTMPVNRDVPNLGPRISDRDARRQAARPSGRRASGPGSQPVHRTARHGGGFARRHLRRRGLVHRLAAVLSGQTGARLDSQPAQTDPCRLRAR